MTTKLYLDDRASGKAPAPLKLSITKHGKTAYISLDLKILPEHWDKKLQKVIVHPQKKMLNNIITGKKFEIERKLLELQEEGKLANLSAKATKDLLLEKERVVTFKTAFDEFVSKKGNRTKEIYNSTLAHLDRFRRSDIPFEEFTPKFLYEFDEYLEKYAPARNARNIHFRNIRAIFNYAIDNDYTTYYPFRKFKIKNEETRKRSLDVETLRKVFTMDVSENDHKFQSAFILMFYLIGINTIDFCNMQLVGDRIEYTRCKTHKNYSIKLEPEMLPLLEELKGETHLVYPLDRYSDYKTFAQKFNHALDRFAQKLGVPRFTTYWARHSWATIAHRIGIPKDTISMALGHSFGNKVTDVYVDYDMELVDRANRKVIDYINNG